MNIVFLSPHFPPNYKHFCKHLKDMGAQVLGIGEIPLKDLEPSLQSALSDYVHIPSLEKYEDVLKTCGYFTYHYGKIDRIESLNEHWLELEAALRTDFHVPGLQQAEIEEIKRKSAMKRKFRRAGVPVAQGTLAKNFAQIKRWIAKVGFPVVAKPDKGVGAAHTYKIHNEKELIHFFKSKPDVDYFVEEFVSGDIISVDGLVDREGKIVFCTSHQNCDGVMEILLEDRHTAYYSLREVPEDMKEASEKIIKIYKLQERFFHFEFFRLANGKFITLEANMRPPGGLTMDMFNYANNIDMYQEWANIVLFNRFESEYSLPYHCGFIGRKWSKDYLHTHEEILARYQPWIVYHTPISPIFSAAMGNYAYLVRSESLDPFFEMRSFVHCLR